MLERQPARQHRAADTRPERRTSASLTGNPISRSMALNVTGRMAAT